MKRILILGAALAAGALHAQEEGAAVREQIDANAESVIAELRAEDQNAAALYARAAGYAVFSATKAGFFVSGGSGKGVVVNNGTGARVYMRMATGGVGLGIGAQQYDLVILFEDAARLDRFVLGGWDSSASAQAAAGQDGVSARSSFIDGVAFYQLTDKGLMAWADVSGTRFWVIEDLN